MEDLLCTVPQHLRDLSICSPLLSSTNLAIEEEKSAGHAPLRATAQPGSCSLPWELRPVLVADQKGGALLVNFHVTSSQDFTSWGLQLPAAGNVYL